MESLSNLKLSSSLSKDLTSLCNLFILFLCLFICLVVKGFDCLSGTEGGGGGGLLDLGGLVPGGLGAGIGGAGGGV